MHISCCGGVVYDRDDKCHGTRINALSWTTGNSIVMSATCYTIEATNALHTEENLRKATCRFLVANFIILTVKCVTIEKLFWLLCVRVGF